MVKVCAAVERETAPSPIPTPSATIATPPTIHPTGAAADSQALHADPAMRSNGGRGRGLPLSRALARGAAPRDSNGGSRRRCVRAHRGGPRSKCLRITRAAGRSGWMRVERCQSFAGLGVRYRLGAVSRSRPPQTFTIPQVDEAPVSAGRQPARLQAGIADGASSPRSSLPVSRCSLSSPLRVSRTAEFSARARPLVKNVELRAMKRAALWFVLGLLGASHSRSASTVVAKRPCLNEKCLDGYSCFTTSAFNGRPMCMSGDECPTATASTGGARSSRAWNLKKDFRETRRRLRRRLLQACTDNLHCGKVDDCTSKVCDAGACSRRAVQTGAQRRETDVDCGGDCAKCMDGMSCKIPNDMPERQLLGRMPARLVLGPVLNASETDIDCGGPCQKCGDG